MTGFGTWSPTAAERCAIDTSPQPVVGFAADYADGHASNVHSHRRAHLLYAVCGVMRVEVSHTLFLVPPTTALYIPAQALHRVQMDGNVAMRALFLREDVAEPLGCDARIIGVSALLRALVLAACEDGSDGGERARPRHLAALALDEIANGRPMRLALAMPRDPRAARVASALTARPRDERSIGAWADFAAMSSRTLTRHFREETGLSFRQWRQQLRLSEGLNHLALGASVARAAQAAGFSDVAAFGTAFRVFYGETPGDARARFAVYANMVERAGPDAAAPAGAFSVRSC